MSLTCWKYFSNALDPEARITLCANIFSRSSSGSLSVFLRFFSFLRASTMVTSEKIGEL